MTFNPVAALNVIECKELISKESPNAIDLGSQTPSINNNFIKNLISTNKHLTKIQKVNLNELSNNMKFSTKDFITKIGFNNYNSIDLNGAYESFKFDLNKDICTEYNFNSKYDLVINNGTGEHVFNQHSLFLNIHNLTKTNGIMLHVLPFIDWINHGFYNFNPIIFGDLAASNKYEIIKISLANRNGAELKLENKNHTILFEQIKPNNKLSNFNKMLEIAKDKVGKNILLVVILKKLSNLKFTIPLQGKYLSDISNIETDYSLQKGGSEGALNQIADNIKRN